jgi:hypothetical protein
VVTRFRIVRGQVQKHADAPHPLRLLPARRERPCGSRCAAEQRDELAAFQVEHPASSPGAAAQKLRLTAQQLQQF